MKLATMALAIMLALSLSAPAWADRIDMSDQVYSTSFSQQDLDQIRGVFPEYGGLDSALLNPLAGLNIELFQKAEISLSFIKEGASYKNSLGYFLFNASGDILSETLIFDNASGTGSGLEGGGSLDVGDTVDLGTFGAGTRMGFYLQADGYNHPDTGNKYYSLEQYNPDGENHFALWVDANNGRVVYGIEDIYGLGDQDYNDMVFTVSITPFEGSNQGGGGSSTPEPASGLLAASALAAWAGAVRRRRRRNRPVA